VSFLTDAHGLQLDPLERVDLPLLKQWRNGTALRSRTREWRPLTMEDQERWFQSITGPHRTEHMFMVSLAPRAISLKTNSTARVTKKIGVIGLCGWNTHDRCAEISFYIGDHRHQGHGFMSRALKLLINWGFENDLRRIWAEVYDFNEPSINLLKKLGFVTEGVLRQHVIKQGRPTDSLMMGLLRDEWDGYNAAAPEQP